MGYFDQKIFWGIRHLLFKFIAGSLKGCGYLGSPSYVKGFGRLYAESGLGIYPGWRIEITQGRVLIGKNVRIGNNLLLNCGSSIIIGSDVTISANVFIGTTDVEILHNLNSSFKNWPEIERPVVIGDACFIGFGAVLLPGTTLGSGCVVGANCVVRGSFPNGSVISSERSKLLWSRN